MIPREPDYLLDDPPREQPECCDGETLCRECEAEQRAIYLADIRIDGEDMMPFDSMIGDEEWP